MTHRSSVACARWVAGFGERGGALARWNRTNEAHAGLFSSDKSGLACVTVCDGGAESVSRPGGGMARERRTGIIFRGVRGLEAEGDT